MDQSEGFKYHGLVQIKHVKTNRLLKGTIHAFVEGLLKKRYTDNFYLGTTDAFDDFYTYFQFEKHVQTSSELYLGDLVTIRNYANQLFININPEKKAECTKQGLAFMGEEQHYFVIQPTSNQFTNELQLQKNQQVRIVSAQNDFSLHSHNIHYKNEEVEQYNEVTGFESRDENDLWELIYIPERTIKNFSCLRIKYEPIYICNKDTIIIRNLWSGHTLHSHKNKYKSTSEQEVTVFEYPRDTNDEWIVIKSNKQQLDSVYITKNDEVILQHKATKNFLSCHKQQTYSHSGQQAFCSSQGPKMFFTLEPLSGDIFELNKPFTIRFNSQNLYLSQTQHRTENKIGIQQETAFIPNLNGMSVWSVEMRKK